MAPNNGLKRAKSVEPAGAGSTTVLDKGTVEARGMGTHTDSRAQIQAEIAAFLQGEGRGAFAELRAFFTVWTFITRLPGPTWCDHHPGFLMRGMAYFACPAGTLVGVFVAVFFDFFATAIGLPVAVAAVLTAAASFWITGCFHEDGLADTGDGFGGGWSRSQVLRIMTDTRLGTYGCAVLIWYVVSKMTLLSALGESEWAWGASRGGGPALVVGHTLSRWTAPYLVRTRAYVDEGGPKYKFYGFMLQARSLVTWSRVAIATSTSVGVAAAVYGWPAALGLLAGMWVVAHAAGNYSEYILGGVMGDFLGATICVADVVVLTLIHLRGGPFLALLSSLATMTRADLPAWDVLKEDARAMAFLRFMVVVAVVTVWNACVGLPNQFVRDAAAARTDADDGEVYVSLDADNKKED